MVKLVAVCRNDEDYPFESRQLPVSVDKSLNLVLQLDDPLQSGYRKNNVKSDLRTFIKNYNILSVEEVEQACMMNGKDLTTFLSHMVPCVGCRRSVEQMFHQLADQGHPALDPLLVSSCGTMSVKRNVSSNPTALFKLFYHDVFHMHCLIENILKSKKNKRCFIHSLEMQKPRLGRALAMSPNTGQACTNLSSLPPAQPTNIPFYGNGSWRDIWKELSEECKKEVVILDCEGILDLMEDYLKRHRFCKDCKSKVARAFGVLVDEIDPKKESGYSCTLYVGLRFCGPKSTIDFRKEAEKERDGESEEDDDEEECCHGHVEEESPDCCGHEAETPSDTCDKGIQAKKQTVDKATETSGGSIITSNQSRHIHVCSDDDYVSQLMTRAEAEISGGRRERHAKTIDVAQEEVLTCISLYLYERLHRLWRQVRAESQTWRVLFYVSVETMRRVFEIVVEEKSGVGKLETLCEELEEQERKLEEKQEKKRQKKKRQKKRKEEAKRQEEEEVILCKGASLQIEAKDVPKPTTPTSCNGNVGKKDVCNYSCRHGRKEDGTRSPGYHTSDLGYSSGCCESSMSSREGSEVTCSDGFCSHDESDCADKENKGAFKQKCNEKTSDCCGHPGCRSCVMARPPPLSTVQAEGSCDECQSSQDEGGKSGKKGKKKNHVHCSGGGNEANVKQGNFKSRLLEMLREESDIFSDQDGSKEKNGEGAGSEAQDPDYDSDDEGLTAEEIAEFELNRGRIHEERIELREKIRKNFETLCVTREKGRSTNRNTGGGGGVNKMNGKKGKHPKDK